MGYVEDTLVGDEAIVYAARLHWAVLLGPIVWGGLLSICTAGIGLLIAVPWFIIALMRWRSAEFAVTTNRVVFKDGVLKQRTHEIILQQTESVQVEQGWWARSLGYGTLTVNGTGGTRERYKGIADPLTFRRELVQEIEESAAEASESVRTTPQWQPQVAGSMKTCPECAEQVQAAARICRYCRHDFGLSA